jgi:hypothetical protein
VNNSSLRTVDVLKENFPFHWIGLGSVNAFSFQNQICARVRVQKF